MAESKQPSSPLLDDDSDKEDLFGPGIANEANKKDLAKTTDASEKHSDQEEKISPDSGCESAIGVQSIVGEDDEVPSVTSHDSSAFYPEPTSSAATAIDVPKTESMTESQERGVAEQSLSRKDKELDEDASSAIEILVSDPKKVGDGMNAYVVYKVTTRTNLKFFRSCEMTVTRRFSDFLGLHEKLVEMYQSQGKVVPQPPEKSVLGMTKVKMTKDETGSLDFVEKRRAALERFLNRIAKHPDLRADRNFIDFLEVDGDLPRSSTTSTLSSAGFARFIGKVGDSINKMTFTMSEPDQWFEDKQEQIEVLDQEFKQLHASLEMLVIHRKELAQSIGQFAKSIAVLGSAEENMALSKALSSLAEIETKVEQLTADQADTDFFVLSELVKDYINLIQSVKDTLNERVKLYKAWKDAETTLAKKRELKVKLEQQRKLDKLDQADQEITEWEQKVTKSQESFDEISRNIRKDLAMFDRQKVKDFKSTIVNYLQMMMNNQQQLASYWESFIPEAKLIA